MRFCTSPGWRASRSPRRRSSRWRASSPPCSTTSRDRRARPRRRPADLARGRSCPPPRAAPRRAAPVPAARGRARAGARRQRGRVPGPEPAGMSDALELSAARRRARDRRGVAVGGGAVRGLPRARRVRPRRRRGRPELLHVGRRRAAGRGRRLRPGAPGRRAAGGQGPVLHRGRAQPVGVAHPRGVHAAVHRHASCAACTPPGCGCSRRPTRTSSRWAPPTRTPRSARCATRGTASAFPAAPPAAAPPPWPPASRRGRSAPTPAVRSASRPPCAGSSA